MKEPQIIQFEALLMKDYLCNLNNIIFKPFSTFL
jgi:hypothetical protein